MKNIISILFCTGLLVMTGCSTIVDIATSAAVATGAMTQQQKESAMKVTEATTKAWSDFTPENEYYIGRSVMASILGTYKIYDNDKATRYVNVLGQTLAKASDLPETFAGYHFLILDTDEINAFAAPGGFIVVSRGLIRCCKTEDEFAAVLAHEVAHIQSGHAVRTIKSGRWTDLVKTAGFEAAKSFGPAELAEATKIFEDSLGAVVTTLVSSGYSRKYETEADTGAIEIMKRVGYSPMGLKQMLAEMEKKNPSPEKGFGKTHPDPKTRIDDIESLLKNSGAVQNVPERQSRFEKALKGI